MSITLCASVKTVFVNQVAHVRAMPHVTLVTDDCTGLHAFNPGRR